MAIKVGSVYKCPFCEFTHASDTLVDKHRDSAHDFLLVPLLREDVSRLIQFIATKDESLISPRLYSTLQYCMKQSFRKSLEE